MYQLYLDTTNKKLTVIILQDNKILAYSELDAWQKQTELALETIDKNLKKCQIELKAIMQVVVANGPGSYTGIRVALTFVKTLKVLNPQLSIFLINSLLLQVGLQKAISILPAYNNKSYLAVFNKGKTIIKPQLVDETAKNGIISDLSVDFSVIEDFHNCNIVENFQLLVPYFIEITEICQLEPCYISDPFSKLN